MATRDVVVGKRVVLGNQALRRRPVVWQAVTLKLGNQIAAHGWR
jgi:hypothetical protein